MKPLKCFNSYISDETHFMISRHWIGIVKKEFEDSYRNHLDSVVMPKLSKEEGLKNAYYLKRHVNEGVEFLIVTEWDRVEDIIKFAGPAYDKAVIDDYAKSLMHSYEKKVKHYSI